MPGRVGVGCGLAILSNWFLPFPIDIIAWLVSLFLILQGCYMWTQNKNRHWGFMFWGLLAPIGLLGIALLNDKSGYETEQYVPHEDKDQSSPPPVPPLPPLP